MSCMHGPACRAGKGAHDTDGQRLCHFYDCKEAGWPADFADAVLWCCKDVLRTGCAIIRVNERLREALQDVEESKLFEVLAVRFSTHAAEIRTLAAVWATAGGAGGHCK